MYKQTTEMTVKGLCIAYNRMKGMYQCVSKQRCISNTQPSGHW